MMLTALIAEDELLVRLGISSSVPWSEMDIVVVGESGDGAEAWELYQKYHPDILVLDVLMPGMSGIELLRRIRKTDDKCAVIIVTNVEKDKVLDETKDLGVSEIIPKKTIKRDDIHVAVRKVCDALRSSQDDLSMEVIDERKAWNEYLFESGPDNTVCEAFGMTGIKLAANERLTPELIRSLAELTIQRLDDPESYVLISRENCELLIWKSLSAKQNSYEVLRNLVPYVKSSFHINMNIVSLAEVTQHIHLPSLARYLTALLNEDDELFDQPLLLDATGGYYDMQLDTLRKNFLIFLPICQKREELLNLKMLLDQFPGDLKDGFKRIFNRAAPLLHKLKLTPPYSFSGLFDMTRCICQKAQEQLDSVTPRIRPDIYRSMAYILDHIMENISREQLSKVANYESSYYSKLFKSETGMSYTEYLLSIRILYSQELLCKTDLPISNIAAECGYSDFSYFSAQFRQFCGMSPREWRKNNSE